MMISTCPICPMELDIEEANIGKGQSGPGIVSKILVGDLIMGSLVIIVDVEWENSKREKHVKCKGQPSLCALGTAILNHEDLVFWWLA